MNDTPLTAEEVARAQLPELGIPQLKGLLTAAQYAKAVNSGMSVGAGDPDAEPRRFPNAEIIATADIDGSAWFTVNGPFGPVIGIYLRNPTDATIGYTLRHQDVDDGLITIGPGGNRRVEFYTPSGENGQIASFTVIPSLLVAPTVHGSAYFEVEP